MDTSNFRFSASSIKTFRQCGTKFKFEKIDKAKADTEVGHARWLGKVVHASIYQSIGKLNTEEGFKSWSIVSPDPNEFASLSLFQDLWEGGVDENSKAIYNLEVGSEKPTGRFFKKTKVSSLNTENQTDLEAAWKSIAREMVKNGVAALQGFDIVQLEKDVAFKFLDRSFSGFLDVVAKDEDGKIVFLDFKTVWDKPTPAKLQEDPQFVLYSHALKDVLGLDYYPDGFFVHLKSGSLVRFSMDERVLASMERMISESFDNMENNIFYHRPGILCNYCDFQSICPQ